MRKILIPFTALLLVLLAMPANAQLRVDVTRGVVEPIPMAVPVFDSVGDNEMARRMTTVVVDDLQRSGLFKRLNPSGYFSDVSVDSAPSFSDWATIGADALIVGRVSPVDNNRLRVEFRLWDVLAGEQAAGLRFTSDRDNWRTMAHKISDAVYERLTGEEGYFNTRLAYIAESGPANNRIKRLAVMDIDGANHQYLTNGDHIVLTPRFSPDNDRITFLEYRDGQSPRVAMYNLRTGRKRTLGNFQNMTFAPRFSPDGDSVVLSLAKDGDSEIYALNLSTNRIRRLTRSIGIDTAPSYAPGGDQIVFESDRGGSQQLYVMASDGDNPRRISFGDGRYGNPVWSPRGDLIAFTKLQGGKFYIGVMRPDGSGERLIASGYHVEGPTWSPNGRVISFFKQGRNYALPKLYAVDLTGQNERQIQTPAGGSDPSWSGPR